VSEDEDNGESAEGEWFRAGPPRARAADRRPPIGSLPAAARRPRG